MNKKVIFGENGEVVSETKGSTDLSNKNSHRAKPRHANNHQNKSKSFEKLGDILKKDKYDTGIKWFEKYSEFNLAGEVIELKDSELSELTKICKSNFDDELPRQIKNNPSDAKWLKTALYKGTAKDRAHAGALLVQSNPLANLEALETLIGHSKHSNKANTDVIAVLSNLFTEALLPADRKLLSLALRGGDWKALRKRDDITQDIKNQVFAYWHFENEIKEHYFEFLKNLQQCIQTGQDANKNVAIICATKLLTYAPEKEQMLLSMLINKLGDPSNKVASKALHHLTELTYKHPNMCGVITNETEKLLFRNNISEKAQHFALSFLSQIAPRGQSEVCTKLVNICFSFFKILVQKGAINNKTMQAILRCLQKSIIDAKPLEENEGQIMNKEMQNTIYRLVHLADIKISIQTLSLLLQLITVKSGNSDRYYNALYKKLLDLNLIQLGNNISAQFLHVIHRSIHIDQNISRAQAFIKRLLQLSLYTSSHMTCGILIVVSKLLKMRPELSKFKIENGINSIIKDDKEFDKFDSDGEEKYEDVKLDGEIEDKNVNQEKDEIIENSKSTFSWHHTKNLEIKTENEKTEKISQIIPTKYDPYHRVPAYAGAEYSNRTELILLLNHFHPTAKVFAENILNNKKIDYYGDPLKDFALPHFLERFSFKNPKKINDKNTDSVVHMLHNKSYVPYGARGQPVKSLTKDNCTEDELFIFNYLEKKRENQVKISKSNDDNDEIESVDDDEFEEYLNSLGKKGKGKEDDDFDLDYMKELGDDFEENEKKIKNKKQKTKVSKNDEDDDSDKEDDTVEKDWGDDDDFDEEEDESIDNDNEDIESGDDDNIDEEEKEDAEIASGDLDESDPENDDEESSFDELDEDDEDDDTEESEDDEPKRKKSKRSDNFNTILKKQTDMSSLFAAADDFAELLEDTGKIKGHGTSNAVFNKDKSSDKQLKWEEKRRSGFKEFRGSKSGKFKKFGKTKKK